MMKFTPFPPDNVDCILPPGKYIVSDISYILSTKDYEELWQANKFANGLYEIGQDAYFVMGKTAHGDGLYEDQDGIEYAVDAGNIGLVSKALWRKDEDFLGDGSIIDTKTPVRFVSKKGKFEITWGRFDSRMISINTDYDPETGDILIESDDDTDTDTDTDIDTTESESISDINSIHSLSSDDDNFIDLTQDDE